ncbi:MAG: PTS transporter subunit EIIC, partial [Elusimicrobiota bacterium]|nr:PTS transporter subunit EIIC [Elusimicrobiota bacterium]
TVQQYGLEGIMGAGSFLNHTFVVMSAVGNAVFANLPLIFAISVALGIAAEEKAVAALSAAISFIIMHTTINNMLVFSGALLADGSLSPTVITGTIGGVLGIKTLEMGVFGGIITGLGVGWLHNKFYKIQLPMAISFFGGVRFVPIITAFAFIIVGALSYLIWPAVQVFILHCGKLVVKAGYFGTFFYGFMERSLVPFGLHHVFYMPFWQTGLGGAELIDGRMVYGAQNIFFAQLASPATKQFSIEAARFLSGKYAFMMAGLPGAALAMYHCAKTNKRKIVGGLLFSAALTSFLTGITEPIEFTFLFVAPLVFVAHACFAGISFVLSHIFDIAVGTTFSCGLIDLVLYGVLQGEAKTHWARILPIFAVYFTGYYFFFKFVINKWDLMTPGREPEERESKLYTKADYLAAKAAGAAGSEQAGDQIALIIAGLGGKANIADLDCCATRLRLNVKDGALVRKDTLKKAGALGAYVRGNAVQVIFGPQVSAIKPRIEERLK